MIPSSKTSLRIPNFKLHSLNAQFTMHHKKRHSKNQEQRFILHAYLKTIERPSLPITVSMCRVAPLEFDYVNLVGSMKQIQDVLADWLIPGLAPGRADGDKRIKWEFLQRKGSPKEVALEIQLSNNP